MDAASLLVPSSLGRSAVAFAGSFVPEPADTPAPERVWWQWALWIIGALILGALVIRYLRRRSA